MPVKVIAYTHPLRDTSVEASVADGQSIRQIVGDVSVQCWINGRAVPGALLAHTRPKSGTVLIVRPLPGDNPWRALAQIGVIIASAVAFAYGGPFAAAAVAVAGNLAINYLLPPQLPGLNTTAEAFNRLAAFTGQANRIAAFEPIPRLYGEMRFYPPIPMTAAPYTELVGPDQYLRMLLCLGYGPLEIGGVQAGGGAALITQDTALAGTPIRIGETDIALYEDVEFEIGAPDQISLYTRNIVETAPGWTTQADTSGIDTNADAQWILDGESAIRTTAPEADEISLDITCNGGLFSINKKGQTKRAIIEFRIEYRLVGAGTWTLLDAAWALSSAKRETFRAGRRWKVARGQYEVQLTRVRTYHTDFEAVSNAATWTALRTIKSGRPFVVPGTVVLALRIRATDQLQGRLESVNVEATSILPIWNGSAWVEQATRTPAWIYADVFSGSATQEPIAKSRLDTEVLSTWAAATDADERYYDGVFDDNAPTFHRAVEVATTGRAAFDLSADGKVSVVRDTVQSTPKMLISPRNSFGFSSQIVFPRPPHALRVRFIDPVTYEDTERLVFDDGYNESNATRYEVFQTRGCKSPEQAWKDGRYHLAQMRLRPETFFYSQDVQHLRYRRGDLVSLTQPVIRIGHGGGRVKDVTTNAGGAVIAFVSDSALFMEPGVDYGIRVQRNDGTISVVGITTVTPSTQSVTLAEPVAGIQPGDHLVFGELGAESSDVKVTRIEPRGDFIARITCVPAAPEILDAETGAIPDYEPVLTEPVDFDALPPPVPKIVDMRSDESVLLPDTDGSLRVRLLILTDLGAFPGSGIQIQARYRDTEDTTGWSRSEPVEGAQIIITNVDQGRAYDVQVRALRGDKTSAWSTPRQHTIIGKSSRPAAVEGFVARAARDRIELAWAANGEADISHYLIREGASWEAGAAVAQTDATSYQSRTPSNGPWWIKAVDTSGNESAEAAQASIDPAFPSVTNVTGQVVDNNVLLRWSSTLGTFDIQTYEVRKGADAATAALVGESDKTFDVIFETASGTYTYWIVPLDAALNEGEADSITLSVDAPPDFILRNQFQTDWEGYTNSNVQPLFSVPLPARLTTRDQTALDGDGVDDYVEVPHSASLNTGSALTIEGRAYFKAPRSLVNAFLNRENAYELALDTASNLRAAIQTTGGWEWLDSGLGVPIGRMVYFAVVYDGANVRFHVDDQTASVAHPDGGAVNAVTNALHYLCRNPGQSHYAMRMAELRIWSVARTTAQIADWKDRTLDGNESGLVLYHRMQEGAGATVADKSGNGNDGAIIGAAWHTPTVRAAIPFPAEESVAERGSVHGYASPQAQIDAGYPYVAQPVPAAATFAEVYDAGALIPSTKVNVTLAGDDIVAGVTSTITISTRAAEGDPWTDHPPGQDQVFATNFRYVRVAVAYTSDGAAFRDGQDIRTILSTKLRNDSGRVTVSANPTTVAFNVAFVDIEAITATPQGTTAKLAMVDFDDSPNPTEFDVYLFNADGTPATGDVRWSARGF